jgi:hypothetical protein
MKSAEQFLEEAELPVGWDFKVKRAIRAAQIDALEWAAQWTLEYASKMQNNPYQAIVAKIAELKGER